MTTARLRLLVACGAAGGIASAYNAPIGGALFVAEIVLGTLAMESFGPLVFSSVVATLTVRQFLGSNPLYEIPHTTVQIASNWEILPHLLLGLLAGLLGPWFLRGLRWSERAFAATALPPYARLALGGLIVGALAIEHPEVVGNGYSVVGELLADGLWWRTVLAHPRAQARGDGGDVRLGGGGRRVHADAFRGREHRIPFRGGRRRALAGAPPPVVSVFTLVGMGAFLSATTHAPIMAIIMLFEMTLDYEIILPLMLACVVAHYVSTAIEPASIYSDSLKRKGAAFVRQQLAALRVADLMKKDPVAVGEISPLRGGGGEFPDQPLQLSLRRRRGPPVQGGDLPARREELPQRTRTGARRHRARHRARKIPHPRAGRIAGRRAQRVFRATTASACR